MDLLRYETARTRGRRDEAVETRWVEIAWYVVAGLGALGALVWSLAAFADDQPGVGILILFAAPFVALTPATVALGLRRSARIERALDQLVQASRHADEA